MEKRLGASKKTTTGETIFLKTWELSDFNVKKDSYQDEQYFVGEGYANTKNKADSFGDIPTNYKGRPVYDFSRLKKNPVLVVDHSISASNIAGKLIELIEDEKGLWFKCIFRPLETIHNPFVKDAVSAFITGFGKALSIGGRWFYEDEENRAHLTKAVMHEISLVGVGADPNALFTKPPKPEEAEKGFEDESESLEALIFKCKSGFSEEILRKIKSKIIMSRS